MQRSSEGRAGSQRWAEEMGVIGVRGRVQVRTRVCSTRRAGAAAGGKAWPVARAAMCDVRDVRWQRSGEKKRDFGARPCMCMLRPLIGSGDLSPWGTALARRSCWELACACK